MSSCHLHIQTQALVEDERAAEAKRDTAAAENTAAVDEADATETLQQRYFIAYIQALKQFANSAVLAESHLLGNHKAKACAVQCSITAT
jgi:hypothetical protein